MAKCLVVDDEPAYRVNLERSLTRLGHQVATADDGPAALDRAGTFCPDVLIADWRLQGELSGMDVAHRLRADNPELLVVIITGFSAEDVELPASPGFALLEKPFSVDELTVLLPPAKGPSGA